MGMAATVTGPSAVAVRTGVDRSDPVRWRAMSIRIEIELTSSAPDGSWTWRAAGAREPRGVLDGSILPAGAAVGDQLRVETEKDIDGIRVLVGRAAARRRPAAPDCSSCCRPRRRSSRSSSSARRGGDATTATAAAAPRPPGPRRPRRSAA